MKLAVSLVELASQKVANPQTSNEGGIEGAEANGSLHLVEELAEKLLLTGPLAAYRAIRDLRAKLLARGLRNKFHSVWFAPP